MAYPFNLLPAHRAAAAGSAASWRALRQASSTALRRLRESARCRPLRGGHSSSKSIGVESSAASRSPSTANASTICRPPAGRSRAGTGRCQARAGLFLELAQRRFGRRLARLDHALGDHPGADILVAPERAAGPDQQDLDFAVPPPEQQDPGAKRRRHPRRSARADWSRRSSRRRAARTVIEHRGLSRRDAIFRPVEADPFAVARAGTAGASERTFTLDLALILAEPVPFARRASLRPPARAVARRRSAPARARSGRRTAAPSGRRCRSRGAGRR